MKTQISVKLLFVLGAMALTCNSAFDADTIYAMRAAKVQRLRNGDRSQKQSGIKTSTSERKIKLKLALEVTNPFSQRRRTIQEPKAAVRLGARLVEMFEEHDRTIDSKSSGDEVELIDSQQKHQAVHKSFTEEATSTPEDIDLEDLELSNEHSMGYTEDNADLVNERDEDDVIDTNSTASDVLQFADLNQTVLNETHIFDFNLTDHNSTAETPDNNTVSNEYVSYQDYNQTLSNSTGHNETLSNSTDFNQTESNSTHWNNKTTEEINSGKNKTDYAIHYDNESESESLAEVNMTIPHLNTIDEDSNDGISNGTVGIEGLTNTTDQEVGNMTNVSEGFANITNQGVTDDESGWFVEVSEADLKCGNSTVDGFDPCDSVDSDEDTAEDTVSQSAKISCEGLNSASTMAEQQAFLVSFTYEANILETLNTETALNQLASSMLSSLEGLLPCKGRKLKSLNHIETISQSSRELEVASLESMPHILIGKILGL